LPKSTTVRSHGNNVPDILIAHVISGDAQTYIDTNRCGKHKVMLGPASRALRTWLAGKNKLRTKTAGHILRAKKFNAP